jgi:hypothetical protein
VTKTKVVATEQSEVAEDSEAETTLVANSAGFTPGKVQTNPFVSSELQFAQR